MIHPARCLLKAMVCLWLCFCSIGLRAQLPKFHNYNILNGLASDVVYDIHQDAQGYLWFATEAGLSRFDGYDFVNLTTEDGLPVNEVLDLYEDRKGRLWCMTFPGIPTYIENGKVVHARNAEWMRPAEVPVYFSGFLEDREGKIWLLGLNSRIFRLDMEEKTVKAFAPEEVPGAPRGIWEDDQGQIWVMGRFVLSKLKDGKFEFVAKYPDHSLRSFHFGSDGKPIGIAETTFFSYSGETRIPFLEDSYLRQTLVSHVWEDRAGEVWVAGSKGLIRYHQIQGRWEKRAHYFEEHYFSRFVQDREGNFWGSTLGQGVFFFPSVNIDCVRPPGREDHAFFSIALQGDQVLAGGYKSWGQVEGNHLRLSELEGMDANNGRIRQILVHPDGKIFLISAGEMVVIHPDGQQSVHDVTPKKMSLGPKGTVFLLGKEEVYQFDAAEALPDNMFRDTAFYRGHTVFDQRAFDVAYAPQYGYICVGNDSLYLFNGEVFKPFALPLPAKAQFLRQLHVDPQGGLWLLMEGTGVAHLVGDTWHLVGPEAGLSSTLMFSIADGPKGSILVGSQKGLNLITHTGGGEHQVKVFDRFDGLPSNVIYDALCLEDQIWVATPAGLAGFNPNELHHFSYDPPVHFTKFKVEHRSVALDSTLVFSHDQDQITIGFKALSFRHEGKLGYRYRLGGKDASWSETSFPQVDLPNLAPGDYVFEVQPLRRDGQPGKHTASLSFTILQPFWATAWFRILLLLVTAGLIFLFFKVRVLSYNRDIVRELLQLVYKKFQPQAYLVVKSKGVVLRLRHQDIRYLEAMGDYVRVITADKVHIVHDTMKKLSGELPVSEFVRIHRSFLVRIDQITGANGKKAVLIGETELAIGRTYKEKVGEILSTLFPV